LDILAEKQFHADWKIRDHFTAEFAESAEKNHE